jgi:hypothetical protein
VFCLSFVITTVFCGCEDSKKEGIQADNLELQTIAIQEAQFLIDTFHLEPLYYVYLQTEQSVDEEGRFYFMDYATGERKLVYGVDFGNVIRVSERYFPNVIRHELLHVYGYGHECQEINGVKVSDYIDSWY